MLIKFQIIHRSWGFKLGQGQISQGKCCTSFFCEWSLLFGTYPAIKNDYKFRNIHIDWGIVHLPILTHARFRKALQGLPIALDIWFFQVRFYHIAFSASQLCWAKFIQITCFHVRQKTRVPRCNLLKVQNFRPVHFEEVGLSRKPALKTKLINRWG